MLTPKTPLGASWRGLFLVHPKSPSSCAKLSHANMEGPGTMCEESGHDFLSMLRVPLSK